MRILLSLLACVFNFTFFSQIENIRLNLAVDATGKIELWNESDLGYVHGKLVVVVNGQDYAMTTAVVDDSKYAYRFTRDFGFEKYEFQGHGLFDVKIEFRNDLGEVLVEKDAVLFGLDQNAPVHGAYFYKNYWEESEHLKDVVYWNDASGHYFLAKTETDNEVKIKYRKLTVEGEKKSLHTEYYDKCEIKNAVILDEVDFLKDADNDNSAEFVFFVKEDCEGVDTEYNATTFIFENELVYKLNGNTREEVNDKVAFPCIELENEPKLLHLCEVAHNYFIGKY